MTAPLELIAAQSWKRAFFTTYALSLSFFEAVILDLLVRSNSREATILSDVAGVRAALSEKGAFRAGREYQVEPIAIRGGVFHPKLTALIGEDGPHLLVGSGNLTFGGWGGNLEVVEHLHPSFAADAFEDAADFFEQLQSGPRVRYAAGAECGSLAITLREAIQSSTRPGNVRLLHNLRGSLADRIAEFATELGGAERLIAAAPFWEPAAAERLCHLLGLDRIYIHSHTSGTVKGRVCQNWPWTTRANVEAVNLEVLELHAERKLHAKLYEVLCRRGRLVISGSANGTLAALGAPSNVEACVVRIQRERVHGWRYTSTEPPPKIAATELGETECTDVGVLRAVLKGTSVYGEILSPWSAGAARAYHLSAFGAEELGSITVDRHSSFEFQAEKLEQHSWGSSLLVIRIVGDDGSVAEGFISFGEFAELRRRAGPLAPRIISLLRGMETPADLAVIFAWFQQNPDRLLARDFVVSGGHGDIKKKGASERTVLVSDLQWVPEASGVTPSGLHDSLGWRRMLDRVFAAFRERRGPLSTLEDHISDDEEEGTEAAAPHARRLKLDIEKTTRTFEDLLDTMLV